MDLEILESLSVACVGNGLGRRDADFIVGGNGGECVQINCLAEFDLQDRVSISSNMIRLFLY